MAVNGSIWIEGTSTLCYLGWDGTEWKWTVTGGVTAANAVPGSIWIASARFCFIGSDGKKYVTPVNTNMGAAGAGAVQGSLWVQNGTNSSGGRDNRGLQYVYGTTRYAVHTDDIDNNGNTHDSSMGTYDTHDDTPYVPYQNTWSNTTHIDTGSYTDHSDADGRHRDATGDADEHDEYADPHGDIWIHSDTHHTNHSKPGHSDTPAHNNHTKNIAAVAHSDEVHTDAPR